MRWLFWLIGLFGLAVALALGARLNDGYVLLVFPPWRMEISLNLFLCLLLGVLLVAYILVRGVSLTLSLPGRAREFRARRSREHAFNVLQDAIRLQYEGRFGRALNKAAEAHETGYAPGLCALIAARAAQCLREPSKQRSWIERARTDDSACEAAALMLEAELGNESRDYDQALAALKRLQEKFGRHIAALRMELRARQGCGDWDGVLRLARQLHKRDALSEKVMHEVCLRAHLENIRRCGDVSTDLLGYLRSIPRRERDARLVLEVARQLKAQGEEDQAAEVIEGALDDEQEEFWQDDLVILFGTLSSREPTARIAKAEQWLLKRPQDAGLLLTLGRLCQQQRLWGKAQSYFEASLALGPSPQAHLELARLFDQLERTEEANVHFRQSVALMA
ncbi:MAG: putative protoheme IX biogenesis protein [Betaproteobacteria bacterium ADurb.Bin341]|nr:MAG: putative protoheme IX biogenesis protein [Betaproteobacteria bacterium ADurb.Bin341]